MHPDAAALLWDARDAGRLIQEFVAGTSIDAYLADAMLKSAVQRQLTIVGEAINRLSKADPETAARITHVPGCRSESAGPRAVHDLSQRASS